MEQDTLNASAYFESNIYTIDKPEWVLDIDKTCDVHIERARKRIEPSLKQRRKDWPRNL